MNLYNQIPALKLQQSSLTKIDELAEALDLSSPATFVMVDFTRRSPKLIDKDTGIDDAILIMRGTFTRTRVVTSSEGEILGIVSMQDIQSRKVLMAAESKGVMRKDLSVADVMVDISQIPAIKYSKVKTAKIEDILHTMQSLGEHYLLVLDEHEQLRGFICSSDIRRAVQIPTDISPKALGFSEILTVLHEHKEIN